MRGLIAGIVLMQGVLLYAAGPNLVPNPGFEDSAKGVAPDGWTISPDPSMVWATDQVHSGKHSMKIVAESPKGLKYRGASITVPVDGFCEYIFEGFIKTQDLVGPEAAGVWGKAAIYYYWVDQAGKNVSEARYLAIQGGTTDWVKIEARLTPVDPTRVKAIMFVAAYYLGEKPRGAVWFDDFSLILAGEEKK